MADGTNKRSKHLGILKLDNGNIPYLKCCNLDGVNQPPPLRVDGKTDTKMCVKGSP